MASIVGQNIKVSIFGESHGPAIGGVLDGLDPGLKLDMEKLNLFMARRRPGQGAHTTSRKEEDQPIFLSGLKDMVSTGAPLGFYIANNSARSSDYENLKDIPRPGHADYPATVKYQGYQDPRGGGHFSGRLTAPVCVIGGILIQALEQKDIGISGQVLSIGGDSTDPYRQIDQARADQDSVGGLVSCRVTGLGPGYGGPKGSSIEARLAYNVLSLIPAVKGIDFGSGFDLAHMKGSQANDPYYISDGQVKLKTNHSGGVLGGISTGQDLVFRLAIKPTPSIGKTQKSVDLKSKKEVDLKIQGRHDPSIVPRVLPVVEAVAAISIYDILKD